MSKKNCFLLKNCCIFSIINSFVYTKCILYTNVYKNKIIYSKVKQKLHYSSNIYYWMYNTACAIRIRDVVMESVGHIKIILKI